MHGRPRHHIWTFAAGAMENYTETNPGVCPCDTPYNTRVPPFIGEDYFCESAYIWPGYTNETAENSFHSSDVLWDGMDCHSSSMC